MKLDTSGLHHFALTVTDLERSRRFYTETLGFDSMLDVPGLALISGYGIMIGLHADASTTRPGDQFDPHRVGLDHLALAAQASDLEELARQLDAAGVRHNGIQQDELTNAHYICLYDPDGVPWELYAMPS